MIRKFKIQSYFNRLYCDKCGDEMKFTYDVSEFAGEKTYKHKCLNCGYSEYLNSKYPKRINVLENQ